MTIKFSAALLAATAIAAPALALTVPPQLYVFGDSSVEQGNLYATPGFERPGPPYFSKDGFSRESNGPVWVEYLAPDIKPVLGAARSATRVNFAYSGATSGTDNLIGVASTGLLDQVGTFGARIAQGAPRPMAGSVAVIAAGVNDFIRDLGTIDLRTTSAQVIGNLGTATRRLSGLGVSRVLVEDAPNFVLAPEFAAVVPPADKPALVRVIRELLDGHNAAQAAALAKVNAELATTDVVTVGVSKLFDHVRANAKALGFTVTDRACYDEAAGTLCSRDATVQNSYLFFDNLHLTTRAQAIQADYYAALIGQLDGSAHAGPTRLVRDVAETLQGEASAERRARRTSWLADAVPDGFALIGEVGSQRVRDGRLLSARGDRTSYRFGAGYADGRDWSVRIVGARQQSDLTTGVGGLRLDGWSAAAAGERLLDARSLVDATTSGDDVARTKPAPDIFATALGKLAGIDASEAIVVGDTPYDAEAAAKCGIATVALRSGGFPDAVLQAAGAIAIYDDAAALLADYAASPLGR